MNKLDVAQKRNAAIDVYKLLLSITVAILHPR